MHIILVFQTLYRVWYYISGDCNSLAVRWERWYRRLCVTVVGMFTLIQGERSKNDTWGEQELAKYIGGEGKEAAKKRLSSTDPRG